MPEIQVTCETATHICTCNAQKCAPGETCDKLGANAVCACNSGPACTDKQVCCPTGCKYVDTDEANCGGCNRKCGPGQTCTNGTCV